MIDCKFRKASDRVTVFRLLKGSKDVQRNTGQGIASCEQQKYSSSNQSTVMNLHQLA
jgi:hypothetical protein